MSLLFNMLSRLVITFFPRSKCLLISWLQSPPAVILEPPKIKSATVSLSIRHEVMGPDAMILVFWILRFKPTFSLSSFTFIKKLFTFSSLSAIRVVSSAYLLLLSRFSHVRLCATPKLWYLIWNWWYYSLDLLDLLKIITSQEIASYTLSYEERCIFPIIFLPQK